MITEEMFEKCFYNLKLCNGRGRCFGRAERGTRPGEKGTRAGGVRYPYTCMCVIKSFVLFV